MSGNTVGYIAALCSELEKLAAEAGHPVLARLLAMACAEALQSSDHRVAKRGPILADERAQHLLLTE